MASKTDSCLPLITVFPSLLTPVPSTLHSPPRFSLPSDGAFLKIPILNTLHAIANVSLAFNTVTQVWDSSCLHIVTPGIPAVAALPPNLHPVTAQLTIPHHPMLDLLPWPTVRERLICMFSMPSALRPLVSQEDDTDDGCFIPGT